MRIFSFHPRNNRFIRLWGRLAAQTALGLSGLALVSLTLSVPFCGVLSASSQSDTEKVFRFHIPNEPHSLDPARLSSTDASYFFNNIMRGLYSYSDKDGLYPENAKQCRFTSETRLECDLSDSAFWSDGKPIQAEDYVRSFRHILSAQSKNPAIDLLRNLKNALEVYTGQKPSSQLGVQAQGSKKLIFEFSKPDPDFLYKLTASILVPLRDTKFPVRSLSSSLNFNGPYKVTRWIEGRRLRLEPNPHFKRGHSARPPVEILFVDEDHTALNLYDKGTLTLLRRLPTHLISKYKRRADFVQVPVARFDYIGFGGELRDSPDLRAALSYSADFRELQKIYDALGIPGCPSLPEGLMDRARCVRFDLKKAREHWAKVPDELKKRRWKFQFSRLGGDDLKKGAEWFQSQWQKNLGALVDLEQTENGVFLHNLKNSPPAVFRKGVGLERPTCLAALETFSKGGAENFLGLENENYESLLDSLAKASRPGVVGPTAEPSPLVRSLCGEGVQFLLDHHLLIPLGRIHFTLLVRPEFKGWTLNEMNQLDLSGLYIRSR